MPAFLFDPTASVAALADYPDLAAATDPRREGFEADWLEGMRKSERQLYRVLGNTHYEHPHQAPDRTRLLPRLRVQSADTVALTRAKLIRRRACRATRRGALRAPRCLGRWFRRHQGRRPRARSPSRPGRIHLAVEVYCPLVWDNLETFCDELTSTVKNIDQPWDFRFELGFEQLNVFDERHRLLHLHPAELNDALADGRSAALVDAVAEALAACLDDPPDARRRRGDRRRHELEDQALR